MSKLLFRLEVCGKCNIPSKGGFILASNHMSNLDPIVLSVASSRKLNFMAKKELFVNPICSSLLFEIGVFPVNRKKADISAIKEALKRIRSGKGLLLFPEGSRTHNASEGEPHGGVGFLASKVNVPIVPAYVKGTENAMPRGAKLPKPEKITVCFGKQIYVERGMPYQKIAQHIMDNIRHLSCQNI